MSMCQAISDIDKHQYLWKDPTMSRVQLALNVDDLETSIAFYSTLFGTEPHKVRPGYANFAVAQPPLKLVLIENAGHGGSINHLGVEVEDVDTVDTELSRLAAAGFATTEERDTTCCYAKQDKFWVQGTPDGERWEVYTITDDLTSGATATDQGAGEEACADAACCN
jgi:catechol 2,3-dioxygenase-like lactoylglutathione lyase family enzyme